MRPHLQELVLEGFSLATAVACIEAFELAESFDTPPSTAPSWGIESTCATEPVPTVSTFRSPPMGVCA